MFLLFVMVNTQNGINLPAKASPKTLLFSLSYNTTKDLLVNLFD